MRDAPDALDLLAIARETLLNELVPALPPERRYDALLIASALAAAVRELEAGDAPEREDLRDLARLLGAGAGATDPPAAAGDAPLREELTRLNARLAAAIRAGAFDAPGPRRAELVRHLKAATVRKLRETNPKYLAAEGFA